MSFRRWVQSRFGLIMALGLLLFAVPSTAGAAPDDRSFAGAADALIRLFTEPLAPPQAAHRRSALSAGAHPRMHPLTRPRVAASPIFRPAMRIQRQAEANASRRALLAVRRPIGGSARLAAIPGAGRGALPCHAAIARCLFEQLR